MIKFYEIPHYNNLRIDNKFNIYILDEHLKIIDIIHFRDLKFSFNGHNLYTIDIINITFYGIKNPCKFNSFEEISDSEIISNGIIFRKIPEVPDGYFISNNGIVYSTLSNKILRQSIDEDGYHRISIPKPGFTNMAIHRLVFKTWKGHIPKGYVIHHIDNHKWNNHIDNIQLTTPFLNSRYAAEDGCYKRTFEWNSEAVKTACKMMEDNISVPDIAKYMGIDMNDKKVYKNFRNQLYTFRTYSRSWVDITSQYNFNDYTGDIRPDSKYREPDIINMRKLYKDGWSISDIHKKYNLISRRYLIAILQYKKWVNTK